MKYTIVLIHVGHEHKPDIEMDEREFENWEEVEKLANHWCKKHEYTTWKLKPLEEKVIKKRKRVVKKSKNSEENC